MSWEQNEVSQSKIAVRLIKFKYQITG